MKAKKTEKADIERKRPLIFLISLVLSLGFVFAAFSYKTPMQKAVVIEKLEWDAPDEIFIPNTEEKKEEIAPPVITVEDFNLVDNDTEIEDDNLLDIFDSEVNDEGIDVNTLMNLKDESKDVEEERVYFVADEMPEFPGGMKALLSFIGNTVKYPVVAQEAGVYGRVIISFVVNKDGRICDTKVMRPVDSALDKEALRVVNMMPVWKPGKQSGKAVRVSYRVPINFKLN